MTTPFSWAVEVLISGTWVDLTGDVQACSVTRGISGNDINDRVAQPGYMQFSLDNGPGNTAGLLGYYTPGHANVLSGWGVALPVRLKLSYDTWTVVKWFGRIETDGINVTPGIYGARNVNVSAVDWMGLAADHTIDLLQPEYNRWAYQAIETVLSNMPFQPQRIRYFDEASVSMSVLPGVFDISNTDTTALGEFTKIAVSQSLNIVVQGGQEGEILATTYTSDLSPIGVIAASSDRLLLQTSDFFLLETGDKLLLDQTTTVSLAGTDYENIEPSYGKHVYNHITEIATPRRLDTANTTVLWTLERSMSIPAGTSVNIRGAYHDPAGGASKINAKDWIDPVRNTDFKANASSDGTGTDMSNSVYVGAQFGAAEVNLYISNVHATDTAYIGGETAGAFLRVRGRGIYIYDQVRKITKDDTSIQTYGKHPLEVEYIYQDMSNSTLYGSSILVAMKNPFPSFETVTISSSKQPAAMLFLEPRSRIAVSETVSALSADMYIQSYTLELTGRDKAVMTLQLSLQ